MNIDELTTMLNDDLSINQDMLHIESTRTPALHGKWLKLAMDATYKLSRLKAKMDRLEKAKYEYYGGKASESMYKSRPFGLKLTKLEIPMYIDADGDVQALGDKIDQQTLITNFLTGAMKGIEQRQWNIKNAIEFIKVQNGIVG